MSKKAQTIHWTPELDTLLMRLTREGVSDAAIAQQLGGTKGAIKMRRFKIKDQALVPEPNTFDDSVLALALSGNWGRAA